MRGKFLLLFAVVMKTWGLLIILSELLMCRRQGEERYFTTGQAGVIGIGHFKFRTEFRNLAMSCPSAKLRTRSRGVLLQKQGPFSYFTKGDLAADLFLLA